MKFDVSANPQPNEYLRESSGMANLELMHTSINPRGLLISVKFGLHDTFLIKFSLVFCPKARLTDGYDCVLSCSPIRKVRGKM